MSISPPPLKRRRFAPAPSPLAEPLDNPAFICSSKTAPTSPLTIYTWNINGLSPFLPANPSSHPITSFFPPTSLSNSPISLSTSSFVLAKDGQSLRANLRRWNWPQILCLQEIKISPQDKTSLPSLRRSINTFLNDEDDTPSRPQYDVFFCLPRDRFNARGFGGKVYGVAALVRCDLVRGEDMIAREVEWDLEGRVLVVELTRSKLVVICVYAVNGTSNPYRCPHTGEVVGTRHDHKRAFHRLLRQEVTGYENRGWGVVVAGDLNVSRTPLDSFPALRTAPEHVTNRQDFEDHFMNPGNEGGLGMVDAFRALRGGERKFTYRPRGKEWGSGGDRVDLVLLSRSLGSAIVDADVLDSEVERGPSDHVPLFVMVDLGLARGEGGGER